MTLIRQALSASDDPPDAEVAAASRAVALAPAEARLLFALARIDRRDDTHPVADGMDWRWLLQLASDENALIALRDCIRNGDRELVPPNVEQQLAILSLDLQFRMRRLRDRLEQLLVALNRAGIAVMLLKGGALACTVYRSFTERAMRDIDLLVPRDCVKDARELMLDLNWAADPDLPDDGSYSTHHHLSPLRDLASRGLRLEIHRSVLPAGHPFRFTEDEIWSCAQPARVGEARALVMHPAHHAVHVAIHFAWSHMLKLGAWNAFRDLDALVTADLANWNEVISTAARWGASSCCYWTLRLGQELSHLAVPHAAMRALQPRGLPLAQRSLTRHFINGVARIGPACPSARLDQLLWNLAIQPRREGHGAVRPWLVSLDLRLALKGKRREAEAASESRLLSMRKSSRYISAILA